MIGTECAELVVAGIIRSGNLHWCGERELRAAARRAAARARRDDRD